MSGKKRSRHDHLMAHLEQHRFISIEEITRIFGVTPQTARRDVTALEAAGKIRRYHGGAQIATPLDPVVYRKRRSDHSAEKSRIAAKVAELLPAGASVFIDTGTTCEAVAGALGAHQALKIFTYSLRVATFLSENTEFVIAVPGGFVRHVDGSVFAEVGAEFLKRFRFDYAVISVSGLEADGSFADDDHAEVSVVQMAMERAEQVILALDSSKFGRRALVQLGNVRDIDVLVTDALPDPVFQDMLGRHGVRTVVADAAATPHSSL